MTSFSFFKYIDAFELDVNVVNFVYYGKTRLRANGAAQLASKVFTASKKLPSVGLNLKITGV